MKRKYGIWELSVGLLIVASVALLTLSILSSRSISGARSAASLAGRKVEARFSRLEKYVDRGIEKIPEDMVIYRYVNDSLKSWVHQFPVVNDNIRPEFFVKKISRPSASSMTPLSAVGDSLSFITLGFKSFLIKSSSMVTQSGERRKVIYALEISNSRARGSQNGVNPALHVPGRFVVAPLSYSEGEAVCVDGVPQFRLVSETVGGGADSTNVTLVWIALALLILGALLFLAGRPSLRNLIFTDTGILLALVAVYLWGREVHGNVAIFSPSLFSSGPFLYSFGALLLINLLIVTVSVSIFIARKSLSRMRIPVLVLSSALLLYFCWGLRCITINSDICLELYKLKELSLFSFAVFLSFIFVILCIPILIRSVTDRKLSHPGRVVFAMLTAVLMVVITALMGFGKERARAELWANRLSIDRDIPLELQLKRSEGRISADELISKMTFMPDPGQMIGNYIIENYFQRIVQDYNVAVYVLKDYERDAAATIIFNASIRDAEKISEDSRYLYASAGPGRIRYTGVFIYFDPEIGFTRMLLGVEAKSNREEKGYSTLLGLTAPGSVAVPSDYSYAKYNDRNLQYFKGNYAYPTSANDDLYSRIYASENSIFKNDGYTHFVTRVSYDEAVIISRPTIDVFNYVIAVFFIALIIYMLLSAFDMSVESSGKKGGKGYYRSRIVFLMMSALTITLISMMIVSIVFVYRRNEDNMRTIMSDKINAVRSLVENQIRIVQTGPDGADPKDVQAVLESVSESTGTDITLYDPSGHVMLSTVPEVFDRMMLGSRIDEVAFDQIVRLRRRYFIHREVMGGRGFYSMYAPLFNDSGELQAIICSPYSDDSFDFKNDAVMHTLAIITVFFILLLMTRLLSTAVVDRLFQPLSEMGRKMKEANLDAPDHIDYDRNDEISSLVESYNRMVDELYDSSRKLAQAERDKAWSGMARQVAHEIKNPLTPMKLQLQRLIRMKSKGDGRWEEKFDEVSRIILDHIDILSDTANEFSVLAKLPSEEMTLIDIVALVKEEITMFDRTGNIRFEYIGPEEAMVLAPKPQLTRVVVNLLTNAVQALENVPDALIRVSLRNAAESDFYDLVVEDNGPGVDPGNFDKLFTPNFTTKSSGSGLGLAISRSILERCNASIDYCKSFSLGGASFNIKYPKV